MANGETYSNLDPYGPPYSVAIAIAVEGGPPGISVISPPSGKRLFIHSVRMPECSAADTHMYVCLQGVPGASEYHVISAGMAVGQVSILDVLGDVGASLYAYVVQGIGTPSGQIEATYKVI